MSATNPVKEIADRYAGLSEVDLLHMVREKARLAKIHAEQAKANAIVAYSQADLASKLSQEVLDINTELWNRGVKEGRI